MTDLKLDHPWSWWMVIINCFNYQFKKNDFFSQKLMSKDWGEFLVKLGKLLVNQGNI
jgi:hypothetical protein